MNYEPLNPNEISILLARQLDMNSHPYTCIKSHTLYPTDIGWVCGKCDYKQKYGKVELVLIRRTV